MNRMSEEKIFFKSGSLLIEGLLRNISGDKGLVVTHPHPLYGGNMFNNVVEAVCEAYQEIGYSTLRFNFRGVGQSEGEYDNGVGEQHDVKAALEYLSGLGKKEIDLAGYSFGSWINALGLNRYQEVNRAIMISPPVDMMGFPSHEYNPKIKLVITGSEDDIASCESIKKVMPVWNPEADFKVIQGTDHFYWGKTDKIEKIIKEFLDTSP